MTTRRRQVLGPALMLTVSRAMASSARAQGCSTVTEIHMQVLGMIVLGLVTFAAMFAFNELCDRV